MTHEVARDTLAGCPDSDAWLPHFAKVVAVTDEIRHVRTLELDVPASYGFAAGQFNMLYLPGFGEAAISISSSPNAPDRIAHTIRRVGNVTQALCGLDVGQQVGIRGPFGSAWPIDTHAGWNIVIAAGGIGLAPLRPAIYRVAARRAAFGNVRLVYGARTPADVLYPREFDEWRAAGIEVDVTVDFADDEWRGQVGVVTSLLERIPWIGSHTVVLSCGPEIMMRFVARSAHELGVVPAHTYVSLERNMNCAMGFCGHCQFGPSFVCKDGPVYAYPDVAPYLFIEDF